MRAPEPVFEIVMPLNHQFMVGDPIQIHDKVFIIVGMRHEMGGYFSTSKVQVVEPSWWWRIKYRVQKLLRPLIRIWNRLRHGNPYG